MNRLIAHSPWSRDEVEAAQRAAHQVARKTARSSKRWADATLFLGAGLAGYAALQLVGGRELQSLVPVFLVSGGALGFFGFRKLYHQTTEEYALAQWRMDHGVTLLSDSEVLELEALAGRRPEALQRIVAWKALGLPLRHRDRQAIEDYLQEHGIVTPEREEGSIADYIEPASVPGNG